MDLFSELSPYATKARTNLKHEDGRTGSLKVYVASNELTDIADAATEITVKSPKVNVTDKLTKVGSVTVTGRFGAVAVLHLGDELELAKAELELAKAEYKAAKALKDANELSRRQLTTQPGNAHQSNGTPVEVRP